MPGIQIIKDEKESNSYMITGLTLGKIMSIVNSLKFREEKEGLSLVGQDVLIALKREMVKEGVGG